MGMHAKGGTGCEFCGKPTPPELERPGPDRGNWWVCPECIAARLAGFAHPTKSGAQREK
jgi:hypothetical protein